MSIMTESHRPPLPPHDLELISAWWHATNHLSVGQSRALLAANRNLRGERKRRGLLTRDPRIKERKMAGLKKVRTRPQFSRP